MQGRRMRNIFYSDIYNINTQHMSDISEFISKNEDVEIRKIDITKWIESKITNETCKFNYDELTMILYIDSEYLEITITFGFNIRGEYFHHSEDMSNIFIGVEVDYDEKEICRYLQTFFMSNF